MIKGLGTDIVEIDRIADALTHHKLAFLNRVFTEKEQAYCLKNQDPAPSLAARFCAKEAAAKALGPGFGDKVAFTDIEIVNDELGKPTINISEKLSILFNNPNFLVSISHCKNYALATVIWIGP